MPDISPYLRAVAGRPALPAYSQEKVHLLITAGLPPRPEETGRARPPLDLSLVIDASSSMKGSPILQAKECARRVVKALGEGDTVSIVSYDSKARVVVPQTEASRSTAILSGIESISAGDFTNLHAGWLSGAETVAGGMRKGAMSRVIVLSDGQTNRGIQDEGAIAAQVAALQEAGVSTSTIGLGHSFNEDLMSAIARAGGGRASYGETADDLWPSFEAELGLLSAIAARDVRLSVRGSFSGLGLMNGYPRCPDGSWKLPDLAHGAEVSAMLELVPGRDLAPGDTLETEIVVSYRGMDGTPGTLARPFSLPVVSDAEWRAMPSDPEVASRLKEIGMAGLLLRAKACADWGDFEEVGRLAVQGLAMAGDDPVLRGMAGRLSVLATRRDGAMAGKESLYASSTLMQSYRSSKGADGRSEDLSFTRLRIRQGKAD